MRRAPLGPSRSRPRSPGRDSHGTDRPARGSMTATRGSRRTLRSFTRPTAVFTRTRPRRRRRRSTAAPTCGEPSLVQRHEMGEVLPLQQLAVGSRSASVTVLASFGRVDDAQPEVAQLLVGDRSRRAGQRIGARLRLREGDHVADASPGRPAASPSRSMPIAMPAVGRHAVPERREHVAELLLDLLGRQPEHLEHAALQSRGGGSGSLPPPSSNAVQHEVVRAGLRGGRVEVVASAAT